jgi:hypothetical protein
MFLSKDFQRKFWRFLGISTGYKGKNGKEMSVFFPATLGALLPRSDGNPAPIRWRPPLLIAAGGTP